MHGQNVPTVGAKKLRDVKILLIAGKAVKEDRRRMRTRAGSKVENAEQHPVVARQDHLFRRSWFGSGRRSGFGLNASRHAKHGRKNDEAQNFHRAIIYALTPVCLV